ncbi:MAG: proton-conducting transporter membrane subunit [Thermoguttaceae bacterium]
MIWALLLVPAMAGLFSLVIRPNWPRRVLLLLTPAIHAGLVARCWSAPPAPVLNGWMALDAAGLLFLSITSALFLAAALYAIGYLASESRGQGFSNGEELPFVNFPEAVFAGCLLLFLSTMTLVTVSRHLGLMWVGVEATTLASAPLIYFHRQPRSLEATWKYLLICSVGIALALLGNFFVAVAARSAAGPTIRMTIDDLVANAGSLNPLWLKAAFLFFLVGYGTKMGLAPLHTWLPDAHSEAPSVVSALLSGALLNCALLTILRAHALLSAAKSAEFSSDLLVLFGLVSMFVAAVFILGQADFKRMLAYSSVEHMGILSLGIGVGGIATFGAMLHAVNHSLTKAMLFLVAGNILALYRTKSTTRVRGLLQTLPISGVLWLVGFLAIVGSPPFGPFLSELTILKGMFDTGRPIVAIAYLLALAVVFAGMATICLRMAYGPPPAAIGQGHGGAPGELTTCVTPHREPFWSVAPAAMLGLAVLVLGVYVPPQLTGLLNNAVKALGAN